MDPDPEDAGPSGPADKIEERQQPAGRDDEAEEVPEGEEEEDAGDGEDEGPGEVSLTCLAAESCLALHASCTAACTLTLFVSCQQCRRTAHHPSNCC